MRKSDIFILGMAAVLILCLLVTAGCTSIPGPEPRSATPTPEKTTVAVTLQVRTLAVQTMTSPPTTVPPTPAMVQITPKDTPRGTYELRTCTEQGGVIAQPGETCPTTWLAAGDTFSCCPKTPVSTISRTTILSIEPLDLVIVIDDDPGRIIP